MRTLRVELGDRAYPIYIGSGLLDSPGLLLSHLAGSQVLVVTNETVAPLYLERVMGLLAGTKASPLILPDGERYKTLETVNRIFDALLESRYGRNCTLIALGGGVIGDMTGFAAASYQRGVEFIQIPTTLLSQVDSSVGGKTGVNHRLGKNMIGAFHQPRCVIADTDTLNTLDDRELSAGIAEIIKYGLLGDADFFAWLEHNIDALLARDATALAYAIERSCQDKADIVASDEREAGVRALLNLGHTFGHAIETGMGYGSWLHGEAVGVGMLLAADLSLQLGDIGQNDVHRVENLISRAGLPTRAPAKLDSARFLELMSVDKKVMDGRMRLILLRAIGKAYVADNVDADGIQRTIDEHHAVSEDALGGMAL